MTCHILTLSSGVAVTRSALSYSPQHSLPNNLTIAPAPDNNLVMISSDVWNDVQLTNHPSVQFILTVFYYIALPTIQMRLLRGFIMLSYLPRNPRSSHLTSLALF